MSLHDYLHKYFPTGPIGGSFENESVDLIPHMLDKFGVHVKQEGNLFQFKYDQLLAKFSFDITKECRGHIWRFTNGVWNRVANPPNKFFNQHEGWCPIFNEPDFVQRLPSLSAFRKEDGTAIQVWFDEEKDSWRASTLGTITPWNVGDYPIKFDELFWSTLGEDNKKAFISSANKNQTYLFELCAVENRIVTKYKTNRVYLLAVHHNTYGTYEPIQIMANNLLIDTPDHFLLVSEGIKSLEDLKKWVESNCNDSDEAEYREGFVIYDGLVPIAKMKTARYLTLHSVGGGDLGHTRNAVIDAFFTGALDDIWGVLHPTMQEFAEQLKDKVLKMSNEVYLLSQSLDPQTIQSQKDYALWVQSLPVKCFSGFFFQNKDIILKKENIQEVFSWWIKNNYKKYEQIWKS
jgi:hypothetical protein